jgi:hypothetical protein
MIFKETNLINTMYVMPYHERRRHGLCAREEIADPAKLCALVEGPRLCWDVVGEGAEALHRTWAPWKRAWEVAGGTIRSSGFYVLCDRRTMFARMRRILMAARPSQTELELWLTTYWDTPFLITCPVLVQSLRQDQARDPATAYFVNNRFPVQRVPIVSHTDVVSQMIVAQAFTLCNGLTLFLAMCRAGRVPLAVSRAVLANTVTRFDGDITMQLEGNWLDLYMMHPCPHVADHPWFYARMGTNPAPPALCNMLRRDTVLIPQLGGPEHGVVTSLATVLLSTCPWDMHWPSPPSDWDAGEDDRFEPDITSFVLGVVRTRRNWRRWIRNAESRAELIAYISDYFPTTDAAFTAWLEPILHFYTTHREHAPALVPSRLRQMWRHVLAELDPSGDLVRNALHRWMVKDIVIHHIQHVQGHNVLSYVLTVPYAFLKDVMEARPRRLLLWDEQPTRVYTSREYAPALLLTFPAARLRDDGSVQLRHHLYHYFTVSPPGSTFQQFRQSYLDPRIVSRVSGIQKGFGMREGEQAALRAAQRCGNPSLVGFLVLEYLREHRDALVF